MPIDKENEEENRAGAVVVEYSRARIPSPRTAEEDASASLQKLPASLLVPDVKNDIKESDDATSEWTSNAEKSEKLNFDAMKKMSSANEQPQVETISMAVLDVDRRSDDEEAGGLPRSVSRSSRTSRVSRVSRAVRQLFCCGAPYNVPSEDDVSTNRHYAI